jgi:hypothetical protein
MRFLLLQFTKITNDKNQCFVQDIPVLWRRSCATLTSGAWSLFCPSMFYITRVDGAMEVWDFLVQSNKPLVVQSISGSALTGV